MVGDIRATGRRVGIWLAPFFVGADSAVAAQHPEWLTGGAGHNWRQDMRGLDLTHPGVREYLHGAVRRLADLGIDYFKLDFLYAGAVPARRRDDVSGVAAYRSGLRLLRDAAGPDAYLVGCGAPILPSVGLVDAMRVSPDTFHEGGEDGSRGLRGRMSLVARAWQQGRFWVNDPDCLVVRPTYALREEWAAPSGGSGACRRARTGSPSSTQWGLEATRRLLDASGTAGALRGRRGRGGAGAGRAERRMTRRDPALRGGTPARAALPRSGRRGGGPSGGARRGAVRPARADPRTTERGHGRALITYGDAIRRAGETPLHTLAGVLHDQVGDLVSDVHLLPMFPWTSDDGFAVVDHRQVNPALGHLGRHRRPGRRPRPDVRLRGQPRVREQPVVRRLAGPGPGVRRLLHRARPRLRHLTRGASAGAAAVPRLPAAGRIDARRSWTTFGPDQVDVNVATPAALLELTDVLLGYLERGASAIRLDAIGFLWKESGTTCLHLPQTHAIVKLWRALVDHVAPAPSC